MGQDPGRLSRVKGRVHLRARRDPRPLVAIEAEALRVVACLAIGGVREDIGRMSLDEVRVMEPAGLRRRVAIGADFFSVTLRAIHGAARGQGPVARREVRWMHRQDDARRVHAKARFHSPPGERGYGAP